MFFVLIPQPRQITSHNILVISDNKKGLNTRHRLKPRNRLKDTTIEQFYFTFP